MAQVVVTVRNCGMVREETLLVDGVLWIGDSRSAVVKYPGPPVRVHGTGTRLAVGDRALAAGQRLIIQERPVEVTVEVLDVEDFEPDVLATPDLRILVATGAIVLLAFWLDQVGAFVRDSPAVVAGLTALAQRAEEGVLGEEPEDPRAVRWVGEVDLPARPPAQ